MNVAELIEELKKYPGDWPVYIPETNYSGQIEAWGVSRRWSYADNDFKDEVEID